MLMVVRDYCTGAARFIGRESNVVIEPGLTVGTQTLDASVAVFSDSLTMERS